MRFLLVTSNFVRFDQPINKRLSRFAHIDVIDESWNFSLISQCEMSQLSLGQLT